MPRLSATLVGMVLTLTAPGWALAAGAYVRKEPIKASAAPSLSTVPSVSLSESFNGCGGRRVRDPKTNQCRGPGDISH
jgi:hypothetical protein